MDIQTILRSFFYIQMLFCQASGKESQNSENKQLESRKLKKLFVLSAIIFLILLINRLSAKGTASSLQERIANVTYRLRIQDIPEKVKKILVWIPVPRTNSQQSLETIHMEDDLPYTILSEQEYGNRFIHLDLSQTSLSTNNEISISVSFLVKRKPYPSLAQMRESIPVPRIFLARFLAPDQLVPINGIIGAEAQRVVGETTESLAMAKRLYYHIANSVTYDKKGKGWGRGDALYTCNVRTGNCTDFHSLFIGEARALGIPARFVMGLPLPEGATKGKIPDYHCWAEFYVKDKGWIPIDASQASIYPSRKEDFFSGLDANRIDFTIGRDIKLPRASCQPLNYIIYPHIEIDGQTYMKVKTDFYFHE